MNEETDKWINIWVAQYLGKWISIWIHKCLNKYTYISGGIDEKLDKWINNNKDKWKKLTKEWFNS